MYIYIYVLETSTKVFLELRVLWVCLRLQVFIEIAFNSVYKTVCVYMR